MLLAFLTGLTVVVTTIVLVVLGIKWFVNYCRDKLEKNKNHKVIFVGIHDIVDVVVKEKVNNAKSMSLDELERMCSETPYVAATYNPETDTVSEYEGFNPDTVEEKFIKKMEENDGFIVISA